MKILIFNWRDLKNPHAGGAEVFTYEIAKRWVQKGHSVTLFCAAFKDCKKQETIDGINIVRKGNRISVYYHAFCFYKKGIYDVVVDEINTIPFFTPLFVKEKKIALIHQLAREFWFYEIPVFGVFGYVLEPLYMRIYSKTKTVTVSQSTKKDLVRWGFQDVSIVSEGIDFKPLNSPARKEKDLTLLFVGRMKKAKKPMDAIKAFRIIKREIPGAKLWMVGAGYINLPDIKDVTCFGRISAKKKHDLMSRAHILLVPAVREGWGLVVTEANALGTPAISYDVGGLRDSIKHKKTGLLCKNNPMAMAESVLSLWKDKKHLKEYTLNALKDSKRYTWDRGAKEFMGVLEAQKR